LHKRVLFKALECFPSALFPKLWNLIELELKETKSAKLFKRKVAKIYLDSDASYICQKTVYHVDKLNLYYLLHPSHSLIITGQPIKTTNSG